VRCPETSVSVAGSSEKAVRRVDRGGVPRPAFPSSRRFVRAFVVVFARREIVMESRQFEVTDRNRVNRVPKRGHYDEPTVHAILDEAQVCHLGIVDGEQPFVLPMFFVRLGDEIVVHGANKGRMGSHLESGAPVCVTATLVDGLVLARSAFHHSMNYRSVVVFGTARRLRETHEIAAAVRAITEKVMPGRADDCRPPNPTELKATTFLAIRIESASAKIRAAGVMDDEEDLSLPYWAGVVPLHQTSSRPLPDPSLAPQTATPAYLEAFLRSHGSRPIES
jgi:nitroimidazol reductase NimA-like FMN-containing flavoprotein (pyridoxamine 5'-phosphate oxidase superfamily)